MKKIILMVALLVFGFVLFQQASGEDWAKKKGTKMKDPAAFKKDSKKDKAVPWLSPKLLLPDRDKLLTLQVVDQRLLECGRYYDAAIQAFDNGDALSETEGENPLTGESMKGRYINDEDNSKLIYQIWQCIIDPGCDEQDRGSEPIPEDLLQKLGWLSGCWFLNNIGSCFNPFAQDGGLRSVLFYAKNKDHPYELPDETRGAVFIIRNWAQGYAAACYSEAQLFP